MGAEGKAQQATLTFADACRLKHDLDVIRRELRRTLERVDELSALAARLIHETKGN